jgi:hypothetical protein
VNTGSGRVSIEVLEEQVKDPLLCWPCPVDNKVFIKGIAAPKDKAIVDKTKCFVPHINESIVN